MLLDGTHVPLTTPFYPDGRVYYRKLEHNVRRYSLTPVSGLIVLGESSEASSLTHDEKRQVLRTVAETAAPEKVLIAAISELGVVSALELARQAGDLRYDTILLQAAFPQEREWWDEDQPSPEILTWFRAIADGCALPVIVASHAAGRQLPVAALAGLAEHPNVIGVLEQSTHISRVSELRAATAHVRHEATTTITFTAATARMLKPVEEVRPGAFVSAESLAGGLALATAPAPPAVKTRTKQVGLQILWSHAQDATEALQAGAGGIAAAAAAGGIAAAAAAAVPQALFEIWAAWKDGDHALMREKQKRVAQAEPFFAGGGVAAVKAGAELSGYFGGRPRLPHLPLTKTKLDELARLLDGMRS